MKTKKSTFFARPLLFLVAGLISWSLASSNPQPNQAEGPINKVDAPTTVSLEDLPPELLTKILEYLSWRNHPKLRLVSKAINEKFDVFDKEGKEKDVSCLVFLPASIGVNRLFTENEKPFFKNHRFNLTLNKLLNDHLSGPQTFVLLKQTLSKNLTTKKQSYPIRELKLQGKLDLYFPTAAPYSSLPYKSLTSLSIDGEDREIAHASFTKFCKKNKQLTELSLINCKIASKTVTAILKKCPKLERLYLPEGFRFDQVPFELLKKLQLLSIHLHEDGATNLNACHLDSLKISDDKEYCPNLAATLTYLFTNYPTIQTLTLDITKATAQKLLDDATFNFFIFTQLTHLNLGGEPCEAAVPIAFIVRLLDCCPSLASLNVEPIPRFDLLDQNHLNQLKKLQELFIPNYKNVNSWKRRNINDKTLSALILHLSSYEEDWETPQLVNFLVTYCPGVTHLTLDNWEGARALTFNTIKQLVWRGDGKSDQLNFALHFFPALQRLDLGQNYDSNLDKTLLDKIPEVIVQLGMQIDPETNEYKNNVYENLHELGKYTEFHFGSLGAHSLAGGLLLPYLKNVQKISINEQPQAPYSVEAQWERIDWAALSACKTLKKLDLSHWFSYVSEADINLTIPPHHFFLVLKNYTAPPSTTVTYFGNKKERAKPSLLDPYVPEPDLMIWGIIGAGLIVGLMGGCYIGYRLMDVLIRSDLGMEIIQEWEKNPFASEMSRGIARGWRYYRSQARPSLFTVASQAFRATNGLQYNVNTPRNKLPRQ